SFSFTAPPPTAIYTLSLHDALPICSTALAFVSRKPRHKKLLLKCKRRVCYALRILVSQSRHFLLIAAYPHWQQAAILLHIVRYSTLYNLLHAYNLAMIPGSLFLPEQCQYATKLLIAVLFATILPSNIERIK